MSDDNVASATAETGNAVPNGAPDQEVMQKVAALRAHVRESFGKIALAMMSLPRYRHQTLADMQHLILDPLIRDRVAIAYPANSENDPTSDISGVAIWASLSEEADSRLRDQIKSRTWPVRLKAEDWNSGDIAWLIDVIAPTQKETGSVVANFRSVVKDGELRLHPVVGQLLDTETLEKLGMKRGGK
ncbi:toxin-activating lysine-acyltransferase [Yoonia sp. 208BN28-4]|uniref:toxin-activating lysine-acyltransferase n=1 Tax=Yoonia sp. 208BN28-4 TaxID=3126505 RepID=UPI0030A58A08